LGEDTMYRLIIFPFIYLILFSLGCGSKVPIADVSEAVADDRLVGEWTALEPEAEETVTVSIFKFNELEYIVWTETEKRDSVKTSIEHNHYRIYVIEIRNKRFINAQTIESLEEEDRLYYFYNYIISNDTLITLRDLQDIGSSKIDEFETSEALYNFISTNLDNEDLYGGSYRLVRIK
jgi:hypothetical protein